MLAKDQGVALLNALGDRQAGLPYTLVIDRQGRFVQRKLGTMKAEDIGAAIRHLCAG